MSTHVSNSLGTTRHRKDHHTRGSCGLLPSLNTRTGSNGSDFSVEDATHVYGGDYDVFPHTTLAQLRSYVSLYGRLVVTFDCEDTVRFLSQHSVMVAENMPTHQKKEGLLC